MATPRDDANDKFTDTDGLQPRRLASCSHCRHKTAGAAVCDAFPAGIPAPILEGRHPHKSSYPGDHGIRYEADPALVQEFTAIGWL